MFPDSSPTRILRPPSEPWIHTAVGSSSVSSTQPAGTSIAKPASVDVKVCPPVFGESTNSKDGNDLVPQGSRLAVGRGVESEEVRPAIVQREDVEGVLSAVGRVFVPEDIHAPGVFSGQCRGAATRRRRTETTASFDGALLDRLDEVLDRGDDHVAAALPGPARLIARQEPTLRIAGPDREVCAISAHPDVRALLMHCPEARDPNPKAGLSKHELLPLPGQADGERWAGG